MSVLTMTDISVNCGGKGGRPGPCPTFSGKQDYASPVGKVYVKDPGNILKELKEEANAKVAEKAMGPAELDALSKTKTEEAGIRLNKEAYRVYGEYMDSVYAEYGVKIPDEYKAGGTKYGTGYPPEVFNQIKNVPWQAVEKVAAEAKRNPYIKSLEKARRKWKIGFYGSDAGIAEKRGRTGSTANENPYRDDGARQSRETANAFCATGLGGGKDNSCSSKGDRAAFEVDRAVKTVESMRKNIDKVPMAKIGAALGKHLDKLSVKQLKELGAKTGHTYMPESKKGVMIDSIKSRMKELKLSAITSGVIGKMFAGNMQLSDLTE